MSNSRMNRSGLQTLFRCLLISLSLSASQFANGNTESNTDTSDSSTDQEGWYQIDLVVIGHLNPDDMDQENWPAALDVPLSPTDYTRHQYEGDVPDLWLSPEMLEQLNADLAKQAVANDADLQGTDIVSEGSLQPLETDAAQVNPVATVDITSPEKITSPAGFVFPLNDDQQRQLNDAAARIAKSRDMTVLTHFSWIEKIGEEQQALQHPLSINVEKQFDIQLDGYFRLYRSRYIHLEVDWLAQQYDSMNGDIDRSIQPPASPLIDSSLFTEPETEQLTGLEISRDQVTDTPLRSARVQQSRRMRSKEIHYLDHPLVGVLVTARRSEPPKLSASLMTPNINDTFSESFAEDREQMLPILDGATEGTNQITDPELNSARLTDPETDPQLGSDLREEELNQDLPTDLTSSDVTSTDDPASEVELNTAEFNQESETIVDINDQVDTNNDLNMSDDFTFEDGLDIETALDIEAELATEEVFE